MSHDTTRDRILIAAGPIFARQGFRKTTVREICDSAGVNLASINYYFGDKQKLYLETLLRAQEIRAQQFPEPTFESTTSPAEKLKRIVNTLLHRLMAMQSEPWEVRLIMREILQPTTASKDLLEKRFRPFFELLLSVVDELVGERLTNSQRQQIGFSIIGQCLHYRTSAEMISMMISELEFQRDFQVDQLTEHITEFSLGAIEGLRHRHHSNILATQT